MKLSARTNLPARIARIDLAGWIEIAVVSVCCLVVFVWLGPGDIFSNTTPTGGDMGAHVWGPAYLRDELLPSWQLRGWSADWYAGFPAFQFYMVLPYLAIVAVDVLLPYGIAFKLVSVSGVVLMPAAGWAMARLARWKQPLPPLCAVAMLLFAFQINFTIYGGNIASTLAGEFAFAMALSAALVYFGLLLRSLETGQGRGRAAVALAVTVLLHPIPAAFAVGISVIALAVRAMHRLPEMYGKRNASLAIAAAVLAQVVVWNLTESAGVRLAVLLIAVAALLLVDLRRTWWVLTIGLVGGALSAFWSYPFVARSSFLNDMGWQKINEVRTNLFFPLEASGDAVRHSITWLLLLAGIAAIVGLLRWDRATMTLVAITAAMGMAFVHWPQHRLWNARILPFWYVGLYLLAAFGLWILIETLVKASLSDSSSVLASRMEQVRLLLSPVVAIVAILFVGLYLGVLPAQRNIDGEYAWGPLAVDQGDRSFVQGWADWNFSGYEQRTSYPTYLGLIEAMEQVGNEHGCGSVLWEYETDELGSYGTPMAPMLLPYWTDGCIASMEGLYFESSPTVPFHFLMQSELSQSPSRAMRDLPYRDFDLNAGVAHLQLSGVQYYAAFSPDTVTAAEQSEALTPVAFADPWVVYKVADSQIVEPLLYEPVVVRDAPEAGRTWTDPAVVWFNDETSWDVPVAADGPPEWERVLLQPPLAADGAVEDTFTRFESVPVQDRRQLEATTVSEVVQGGEKLSFRVDRVGVPVLVKVSYFPNWSVSGADGPYRVTPNWMVVVPTSEEVEMRYSATGVEYTAWGLTILGLLALVYFAMRPPVRLDKPLSLAALRLDSKRLDSKGTKAEAEPAKGERAEVEPVEVGRVSIILPAYQAGKKISSTISEIRAVFAEKPSSKNPSSKNPSSKNPSIKDPVEIIVVDDGSSDDTFDEALKAGADRVISFPTNRGKGAAVRSGMLAASGDIRIFTDVDLAYPPHQLKRLVTELSPGVDVAGADAPGVDVHGFDVVVGNRRHADSTSLNTGSRTRTIGSRLFNIAARLVLLGSYRDTQCGLKGFTASAAEQIFSNSYIDGFAFDVEVLYLTEVCQMRVKEVPVEINHDADSTVRLVPQVFTMLSSVMGIRRRIVKGLYNGALEQSPDVAGEDVAGEDVAGEDVAGEDVPESKEDASESVVAH